MTEIAELDLVANDQPTSPETDAQADTRAFGFVPYATVVGVDQDGNQFWEYRDLAMVIDREDGDMWPLRSELRYLGLDEDDAIACEEALTGLLKSCCLLDPGSLFTDPENYDGIVVEEEFPIVESVADVTRNMVRAWAIIGNPEFVPFVRRHYDAFLRLKGETPLTALGPEVDIVTLQFASWLDREGNLKPLLLKKQLRSDVPREERAEFTLLEFRLDDEGAVSGRPEDFRVYSKIPNPDYVPNGDEPVELTAEQINKFTGPLPEGVDEDDVFALGYRYESAVAAETADPSPERTGSGQLVLVDLETGADLQVYKFFRQLGLPLERAILCQQRITTHLQRIERDGGGQAYDPGNKGVTAEVREFCFESSVRDILRRAARTIQIVEQKWFVDFVDRQMGERLRGTPDLVRIQLGTYRTGMGGGEIERQLSMLMALGDRQFRADKAYLTVPILEYQDGTRLGDRFDIDLIENPHYAPSADEPPTPVA